MLFVKAGEGERDRHTETENINRCGGNNYFISSLGCITYRRGNDADTGHGGKQETKFMSL